MHRRRRPRRGKKRGCWSCVPCWGAQECDCARSHRPPNRQELRALARLKDERRENN